MYPLLGKLYSPLSMELVVVTNPRKSWSCNEISNFSHRSACLKNDDGTKCLSHPGFEPGGAFTRVQRSIRCGNLNCLVQTTMQAQSPISAGLILVKLPDIYK